MQSINEVLEKLDQIIAHCKQNKTREAYFAILYRRMTAAVKEGIANGAFADGHRMEKLDVIFASRYVDAWNNWHQGKPVTESWQHAFDATKKQLTVFQHLLLGINTHINLDLSIAAAATSPGESIFELEDDFNRINDVIADLSMEMQQKLGRIWWPMRLVSKISKGTDNAVLNFSIEKARKAAWANAVAMAIPQNNLVVEGYIRNLDQIVLGIARKIENPGGIGSVVLAPVRWFETRDVAMVINKLQ